MNIKLCDALAALVMFIALNAVNASTAAGQTEASPSASPHGNQIHVQDELFVEALKSFHKLANATQIGINFIDYRRVLLDAKTDFDTSISKFPPGSQHDELEAAMEDYIIAADAWELAIENVDWCRTRYQEGIPTKNDFYRGMRARYGKVLPEPKLNRCIKERPVLRLIWSAAEQHLEHAINLQKLNAPRN